MPPIKYCKRRRLLKYLFYTSQLTYLTIYSVSRCCLDPRKRSCLGLCRGSKQWASIRFDLRCFYGGIVRLPPVAPMLLRRTCDIGLSAPSLSRHARFRTWVFIAQSFRYDRLSRAQNIAPDVWTNKCRYTSLFRICMFVAQRLDTRYRTVPRPADGTAERGRCVLRILLKFNVADNIRLPQVGCGCAAIRA